MGRFFVIGLIFAGLAAVVALNTNDKNWCADIGGDQGLYGATDDFEACCPEDCGKCGGDGCGDGKPGGRCCITQIYNRGRLLCTDEGATLPCIISTKHCDIKDMANDFGESHYDAATRALTHCAFMERRYPECNVSEASFISVGNGLCNPDNYGLNNAGCGYDGGDCCKASCEAYEAAPIVKIYENEDITRQFEVCQSSYYDCKNPLLLQANNSRVDSFGYPRCEGGPVGLQKEADFASVCCPITCDDCGNTGCSQYGNAKRDCCVEPIYKKQSLCSSDGTTAPCSITSFGG